MKINSMSNQPEKQANQLTDDEIDLRQVASTLSRHKALIAKISVTTLLFSCIYAITQRPVWEGRFQIVLEDKNKLSGTLSQLTRSNPKLANLANLAGSSNKLSSLKTEINILESPSVLKPIYAYVLEQKREAGFNVDHYSYYDWMRGLNVELVKGSSVLNIAYQDTEKDLVLPVIQRISQTYQNYSGRDRSRGLTQAVSYL